MRLPFNMDKAQAGAQVVTRDGREVRTVRYFAETHDSYCIAASVRRDALLGGGFEIILYKADGTGSESGRDVSNDDLFLQPRGPEVYWVNLYTGGVSQWQRTEEAADEEDRRRRASLMRGGGALASRSTRLHDRAVRVEVREAGGPL